MRPKIVRIQSCDVFAPALFKCFIVVALYPEILASFQHPDHVGVTFSIGMSYAERRVGRTVIGNDYFDREIRSLIDGAVNGSWQPSFRIERRDCDAHQRIAGP